MLLFDFPLPFFILQGLCFSWLVLLTVRRLCMYLYNIFYVRDPPATHLRPTRDPHTRTWECVIKESLALTREPKTVKRLFKKQEYQIHELTTTQKQAYEQINEWRFLFCSYVLKSPLRIPEVEKFLCLRTWENSLKNRKHRSPKTDQK